MARATLSGSWRWESRSEKRQRERQAFESMAERSTALLRAGDIGGARSVWPAPASSKPKPSGTSTVRDRGVAILRTAQRVSDHDAPGEPKPKHKGGGLFDRIGSGLDKVEPDIADLGAGLTRGLDAGRDLYVDAARETLPRTLRLGVDVAQTFGGGGPKRTPAEIGRDLPVLTESLLPERTTRGLPNPTYFPVRGMAEGFTSPLGLATAPIGEATIASAVLRNAAAEYGANVLPRALRPQTERLPAPARPFADLGLGLVGGLVGYKAGAGIAKDPAAPVRAIDRLSDLEARVPQGLGSAEAGEVAVPALRRGADAGAAAPNPEARRRMTAMLRRLEPTGLIASAYGQLPFLRERGVGQMPRWLVDSPDAYSSDSLIPLKQMLDTDPRLPVTAKISNRFWNTLGAFNPQFRTRLDDPRVRQIGLAYQAADRDLIPHVSDVISQVDGAKAFTGLERDDVGRALLNGKPIQFINEKGVPIPQWYAGWADVLENPARYPEVIAAMSPEQRAAQIALSQKLNQIQNTSIDMGIKVEGSVTPGEGGVYVPRGRPVPVGKEDVATSYRGARYEGRKAGSTQERQFKSQAEAIAKGYRYPDPVEAVREYVEENLRQQSAVHASALLKQIPLGERTVGAATLPTATADELTDLRGKIRPAQRQLRDLKREKAGVDRDVRLESRFQRRAFERHVQLRDVVQSATARAEVRAAAAREAFDTARAHLDDVLGAARDMATRTATATSKADASRRRLSALLDEAQALSKRLDDVEDEMLVGADVAEGAETFARHANFPPAMYREAEEAWKSAEQVKRLAAREAARIERKLSTLALSKEDVAADLQEARAAALKAREQFGEALTGGDGGARRTAIDMAEAARDEAKAAANVRAAMAEGRSDELRRVFAQRQVHALDLVDRQSALGKKIEDLSGQLEPLKERRRDLLTQVRDVKKLARERSMEFSGEVNLEPLRGVPVPADLANAFNKYLSSGERGHGVALLDLVNNTFRALGATADASRQMTVGLLGQADRPLAAAKGFKSGARSAIDPSAMWRDLEAIQARYKAKGIDIPLEVAVGRHGLQIAASEQSLVGVAKRGTFEERLSRLPIIKQADALYSAPGNIERVERFYATLADQKRAGKDWSSPQAQQAAANIANLVSGRARRGILAPLVGEEVSGRVAFAGRFVESQFETVANAILTGGIEGYEARRALLRLALGGAALTYGINELLNEETEMDPRDPNFMRVRILGRDVSLFGPWDSLVRGVVRTVKEKSPESFIRSKFAPVPSLAYDITRGGGENPVGEPIGFTSIEGALNTAPVPFGLRDITETAMETDLDDPTSLAAFGLAAGASLFGIKNTAMTPTERLNEIAQSVIDPETGRVNGRDFYDSSRQVQALIKQEQPALWEEKVNAATKRSQEWEEIKVSAREEQDRRDASLLAGEITIEEWESARTWAKAEKAGQFKALYGDEDFEDRDPVLDAYFDMLDATESDGVPDFEARDAYLDGLSSRDRAHIESETGVNATPLERLRKRLAAEYYELPVYRGYDADEGQQIDAFWQEIRNQITTSSNASTTRIRMLRQLRAMADSADYDPRIVAGVRRRILGVLDENRRQRDRYARQHPEIAILTGRGVLSTEMAEAVRTAAGEP